MFFNFSGFNSVSGVFLTVGFEYQYLMTKRKYVDYAIFCGIWSICFACTGKNNDSDLAATEAINSITEVFKSYPIVALGESHGWKEESEFIFSLIKSEQFQQEVNDIVVECGNAKYQSLMDDYVMNGKQVRQEELQQVWRNMTVLCTCDAPIYEELFTTVRSVNKGLKGKQLRVLLGEPALDWSSIRKGEDLNPWIIQRDVHYAGVVEKEVLVKAGWGVDHTGATMFTQSDPSSMENDTTIKLTALPPPDNSSAPGDTMRKIEAPVQPNTIIKRPIAGPADKANAETNMYAKNVFQILQQTYPNKTFVILPHDGFGDVQGISKIEEGIRKLEKPQLLLTKHSWIGKTSATVLFSHDFLYMENGNTTKVSFHPYPNSKIADLCDAYLYITPKRNMHRSVPSASIYDKDYLRELNRRSLITSGQVFILAIQQNCFIQN